MPRGGPLNPQSFYNEATEHSSELSFDVSNSQISASIDRSGDIRRACICCGVEALPAEKIKGGVYCTKRLLYGGPWITRPVIEGIDLSKTQVDVALIENLLPLFSQTAGDIHIQTLVFAPIDPRDEAHSPRSLLQVTLIQNSGNVAQTAKFSNAEGVPAHSAAISDLHDGLSWHANDSFVEKLNQALVAYIQLDSNQIAKKLDEASAITIHVAPHSVEMLTCALILTETKREQDETLARLASKSVSRWLEDTLDARQAAYGSLSIPQDTFVAESMVRFAELARQSALRSGDGRFSGGFLGSDVDVTPVNWTRDAYYSMLAMSIFDTRLCADSIPYFLKWGQPSQTTGPGRSRFPDAAPISQSLSNSVSGLSLAAAYYRSTGDIAFFLSRPEILEEAKRILSAVSASRRYAPMLFPSLYFSDGEARGDFHTGSNVAAWFAYKGMARITSEAYGDEGLAHEWSTIADAIKDALSSHCTGDSTVGRRFFEGANTDGTFILGHDGEESETTLMPFYGFCQSDDSRLLNHAALAMTTQNPLYSPALDAIWWFNAKWSSATFPGWITALAGASDEQELQNRLDRIRSLIDLDGSPWWWPYPYDSKERSRVLRADVARKCGWGAAVYLCRFIHDVLGLSADAPSRTVNFSPFTPWRTFAWKDAKLGAMKFDVAFDNNDREVSATIVNHNPHPYSTTVTLTPPKNSSFRDTYISSVSASEQTFVNCWDRSALRVTLKLFPGQGARIAGKLR
jgi:hypothetical protein